MEPLTPILYEHATGFSLFIVQEFEDIGRMDSVVEAAINDAPRFKSIVKLKAFAPFPSPARALENCNMISEGTVHDDLVSFLETHLPGFGGKKKIKMGVTDSKLATTISETLPQITCLHSGAYPVLREIFRGIRMHFATLVKGLSPQSEGKAQLGLGHGYSRAKVKFNVHRDDNMIIQSIALLDQLDKDINTFGMRIREWYSYHFPELFKLVPDHHTYCRCAALIKDRRGFTEDIIPALTEITADEDKAREIFKASQTSMGMDISEIDLLNIERFTARVIALGSYRKQLQDYLHDKMDGCAPSLSALIGDQVGARLISHAGSLTNLAKYPASTIQILGAEKALFRALKTRGNTPKYGLLFNSTFIGRAQAKNKGRISRYLANKCAIASRVDCFSEVPVATFGEFLKQQVEDRLKYFDTGEKCGKNVDIMHEAVVAATAVQAKVLKKRKKKAKKDAAELAEQEQAEEQPSGKKKKKKAEVEEQEEEVQTPVLKKKKKKSMAAEEEEPAEETPVSKKKKKQKQKEVKDEPMDSD